MQRAPSKQRKVPWGEKGEPSEYFWDAKISSKVLDWPATYVQAHIVKWKFLLFTTTCEDSRQQSCCRGNFFQNVYSNWTSLYFIASLVPLNPYTKQPHV